jgi:SagB-type dehydrogenase family enzyme
MRLKRSSPLAILFEQGEILGINFLKKNYFKLNASGVELLAFLYSWKSIGEVCTHLPSYSEQSILKSIEQLVNVNAIIIENSQESELDKQYESKWEWGTVAGLHHFLVKEMDYLTIEEGYEWLISRAKQKNQPDQFQINNGDIISLPYPQMNGELFEIMLKRRSERKFTDNPLPQQAISDILFTGFGITAMVDDDELGWLPLKMTPSGGARNPFEGYIAIKNVNGLAQGFYHYDGVNKNLEMVCSSLPSRSQILGNQEWADEAGAVIFLVANFERTMWKYPNPAAYRIVLIEAGHIAQNMMLAAVKHNLVSAPTSAISNSQAEGILKLDKISASIVYSLSLGFPDKGFDTLYN